MAPVVQIGQMTDIDEEKELAEYRAGCLALPPEERIAEMRRLNRRSALTESGASPFPAV